MNLSIIKTGIALSIAAFGFCNSASANLIIGSDPGVTYQADGYTSFTTSSAEMIGLNVTVTFANGATDSAVWGVNGIAQNGWTMTQGPGSTFNNPFTLTNNAFRRIVEIEMHGGGTTTLFDRDVLPSTTDTANGRDLIEVTSLSQSQDVTATYFDAIQTTGSTPVGDIFAGLNISFENGIRRNGQQFSFVTDTDNSTNLLRPYIANPEPATMLKTAILLIALVTRRRRSNCDGIA